MLPERWRARLSLAYYRRLYDPVRNWARAWRSKPEQDVFAFLHLAWLAFSAALVRSWTGLGVAIGVLMTLHLITSFADLIGKFRGRP